MRICLGDSDFIRTTLRYSPNRALPRIGGHFQKDRSNSMEVHHVYEKLILEGVQGGSGQIGPEYGI